MRAEDCLERLVTYLLLNLAYEWATSEDGRREIRDAIAVGDVVGEALAELTGAAS